MSQQGAVRSGDDVVQELLHLDRRVKDAHKVLALDGHERPRLLAELNARIEPLGLKCVPIDAQSRPCGEACSSKVPCKTFSDIELAPLVEDQQLASLALVAPVAPVVEVAQAVEPHAAVTSHVMTTTERPDMSKPINWQRGDVFTENPRFTLLHLRREWALSAIDVTDSDTLKGLDVEIQQVGADNVQELMTIKQFMSGYVFVRRPQSAEE